MFFITEKSEETTFSFSQNSATIIKKMETQKIVNLLNGSNKEIQNLQQRNGILLIVNQMVIIHVIIQ